MRSVPRSLPQSIICDPVYIQRLCYDRSCVCLFIYFAKDCGRFAVPLCGDPCLNLIYAPLYELQRVHASIRMASCTKWLQKYDTERPEHVCISSCSRNVGNNCGCDLVYIHASYWSTAIVTSSGTSFLHVCLTLWIYIPGPLKVASPLRKGTLCGSN